MARRQLRRYRRALLIVQGIWLAVLGFGPPGPASAQVILNAVPGGLVEIPLASLDRPRPEVFFGQHRVLVMQFGRRWVGLVGLPLSLVPGRYLVRARLDDGEDPVTRGFTVYPRQLDEDPVVELPARPGDIPEIDFTWREPLEAGLPLESPVSVPAEPIFGRYRQASGSASAYVEFVAFRIGSDAYVSAPGKGRIAAIQTRTPGIFVWVDHGMSLFSSIGPLSRVAVQKDDPVEAGQRIGRIVLDTADKAKSLHWAVFLNGAAVNPFLISRLGRDTANDDAGPPSPE